MRRCTRWKAATSPDSTLPLSPALMRRDKGGVMRRFLAVAAVVALAGCEQSQPLNVIYKAGSTQAERQKAYDLCEFESVRMIPRAMAVSTTGGYYNPGTVQCNTVGGSTFCNNVGGVNIPASSVTYDANMQTRVKYISRCLEAKGYQVLSRPPCRTQADRDRERQQQDNQTSPASIRCAA